MQEEVWNHLNKTWVHQVGIPRYCEPIDALAGHFAALWVNLLPIKWLTNDMEQSINRWIHPTTQNSKSNNVFSLVIRVANWESRTNKKEHLSYRISLNNKVTSKTKVSFYWHVIVPIWVIILQIVQTYWKVVQCIEFI